MPMSKPTINPVSAPPTDELRRTFEAAFAQVQQSGKTLNRSQTPIFVRTQRPESNDAVAEKQALTAAARALAQLWNISPTLIR